MTDLVKRIAGQGERLFAEAQASSDETSFKIENTSEAYYDSAYFKKHKEDVQKVPPPRVKQPRLDLADVLGADFLKPIVAAEQISFHSVGDTGAAKVNRSQKMATAIRHEAGVADLMADDVERGGEQAPVVLLPPRRHRLQLRRGPVLLRPVLRALPRLRSADLRDRGQPRRDGVRVQPRHSLGQEPDRLPAQLLCRRSRGRPRTRAA